MNKRISYSQPKNKIVNRFSNNYKKDLQQIDKEIIKKTIPKQNLVIPFYRNINKQTTFIIKKKQNKVQRKSNKQQIVSSKKQENDKGMKEKINNQQKSEINVKKNILKAQQSIKCIDSLNKLKEKQQLTKQIKVNEMFKPQTSIIKQIEEKKTNIFQKEKEFKIIEQQKKQQQITIKENQIFKKQTHYKENNNKNALQQQIQRIKLRRLQREENKKKEQSLSLGRRKQRNKINDPPHIAYLSNPLEHFVMSQSQIEIQIQRLLSMKESILQKIQSDDLRSKFDNLQRFTESYNLITQDDPDNKLAQGMLNYNVGLMNEIGAILMTQRPCIRTISAQETNLKRTKGLIKKEMEQLFKKVLCEICDDCPICMNEIQVNTFMYRVDCGHQFHAKCLQEWVDNYASCPSCRFNFKHGK